MANDAPLRRVPADRTGPQKPSRILIAAHAHPALSKGGAEIAAWHQFERFAALPGWEAWFIGCAPGAEGRVGSHITQPFSEREFLYTPPTFDWFKFANIDPRYPREIEAVLRQTAPDILHFHHYANFGVETFLIAKRTLPEARIVLTLHEFQAICNHYGQMVTRPQRRLCYEASPRACHKCFPETGQADFFLRREYIMRFFELVDAFIAPSRFLADRYVAWGLPAGKMSVIENVNREGATTAEGAQGDAGMFRVAFFGQLSSLKGIHVFLEAAKILEAEAEEAEHIVFDIHGEYNTQPKEFQDEFLASMKTAGRNLRYRGPYDNQRVDSLMATADVVVIPSIWWENSPVVIQECLRAGRPVVCSNIGGMAEKVRDGVDGFHFNVGDAAELAALLRTLAGDPARLAAVRATMRPPVGPAEAVQQHVELYKHLFDTETASID